MARGYEFLGYRNGANPAIVFLESGLGVAKFILCWCHRKRLLTRRQVADATKPHTVVAFTRTAPAAVRNAEVPGDAEPRAAANHSSFTWFGLLLVVLTPPIAYPLPAVARKILDSAGRAPFRIQTDRGRTTLIIAEVRVPLIGRFIAPGVPDTQAAASRRTLPLGLARQPSTRPGAVRRRFEPTHTHHGTIRITQLS